MKNTWHNKYKKCSICKTTEIRHIAKGLCANCYSKKWKADNKAKIDIYNQNYYAKYKDKIIERSLISRKEKQGKNKIYTKRILNALRKNGYTDKRITSFFGIKIK